MTLNKTLKLSGTLFSWRTRYILVIYKCMFFSDCNFWCCLESKATYFDRDRVSVLLDFRRKKEKSASVLFSSSAFTLCHYTVTVLFPFAPEMPFPFSYLLLWKCFWHYMLQHLCSANNNELEATLELDLKPFIEIRKGQTLHLHVSAWVMI